MKSIQKLWKRCLQWIGAVALLLTLAGCAKAPVADVAATKKTDQIVTLATEEATVIDGAPKDAQAPDQAAANALAKRLAVPEQCAISYENEDGSLRIVADAPILLPDADRLPVARVKIGGFSQELIDRLFRTTCGDTSMYDYAAYNEDTRYSKEELRGMIDELERLIAYAPEDQEVRSKQIDELTQQIQNAPDTIERTQAQAILALRDVNEAVKGAPKGRQEYVALVSLPGGYGKSFSVFNTPIYDTEEIARIEHPDGVVEHIGPANQCAFHYEASERLKRYLPKWFLSDTTVRSKTGDAIEGSLLKTTPLEARRIAEQFLQDAGLSAFTVDTVLLYTNIHERAEAQTAEPAERHCYRVYCVRTVNGVSVASKAGYGSHTDAGEYAMEWQYEGLVLTMDDSGILKIDWESPLEVTEIVTEDAKLLPYTEIEPIMLRILRAKCEAACNASNLCDYQMEVSRVTLALQRISDHDSYKEGLLVPVWNVYGKTVETRETGERFAWQEDPNLPLLSINAIDGSIIDMAQGY